AAGPRRGRRLPSRPRRASRSCDSERPSLRPRGSRLSLAYSSPDCRFRDTVAEDLHLHDARAAPSETPTRPEELGTKDFPGSASRKTDTARGVECVFGEEVRRSERRWKMPARTPEETCRLFREAIRKGDLESALAIYDPEAALLNRDGVIKEGAAGLREELAP